MSSYSHRGTIAGAFVGVVAAVINWDGNFVVAISSVFFGAAIGWSVGYFLGKRRPR